MELGPPRLDPKPAADRHRSRGTRGGEDVNKDQQPGAFIGCNSLSRRMGLIRLKQLNGPASIKAPKADAAARIEG